MRWILRLADCTFFRLESCPYAPPEAVAEAVAELLERRYAPVTRYAENLYRREPPTYSHMYGQDYCLGYAATRVMAPPVGSGLGSSTARLTLGVSNQVSLATYVAVTDPTAAPPHDLPASHRHVFEYRSNERRNELTWHEVTLLEAIREGALWNVGKIKYPVEHLLSRLTSPDRLLAVGSDALVRRDQLRWAADTEEPPHPRNAEIMAQRLAQVLRVLPKVLDEPQLEKIRERHLRRSVPGRWSQAWDRLRWRFSF